MATARSTAVKPPRAFFAREARAVACELLGLHLIHCDRGTRREARIVETEAYLGPEDLAAHSAGGRRTTRTEVMFGPAGHAYVYLIYGMWNCLNVVTAAVGVPHAVLVRALEPVANVARSTWGPGLATRAMHIDRGLNGIDLRGDTLWIERPAGGARPVRIGRSTRIGVEYAGGWARRPWRYFDRDSPYVSSVSEATRRRAGIAP